MGKATGIELTLLSAVAVHAEIEELLPRFRQQEGTEVKVNYDVNPAVAKRAMDGVGCDAEPRASRRLARVSTPSSPRRLAEAVWPVGAVN